MFCITYDTTCYADPQHAFDSFMRQLREFLGLEIGCRSITLSPKSHPKEAAPAPMKRRTIATQTTQTKEITYA